jgi:hypothetical protein
MHSFLALIVPHFTGMNVRIENSLVQFFLCVNYLNAFTGSLYTQHD